MQLKRFAAVVRLNFLLQMRSPFVILLMTVIPLVMIPFMEPAFKSMLLADGYANATGVEQAVPAMAVLFSFLSVQTIIQSFFHESIWGMLPRINVSATSSAALLSGKATVAYIIQTLQAVAVMALGTLLFGFHPTGSIWALLLVLLLFSAVLSALGVAIALWAPSEEVALTLSNVIGMLAAGVGGSFCTISSFPSWAQPVAPFSPAYWALDAVHAVSLDGSNVADIAPQLGMLAVFLAVFVGIIMVWCLARKDKSTQS